MTISGVSCGTRTVPALDRPTRATVYGVSAAGSVTGQDFGRKIQDVPIVIRLMVQATKDSLKAQLMDTIKPGNLASVTPDSGDDLGIGAAGAVNLTFISFRAFYEAPPDRWRVEMMFRKYS